jgi:hypothetical protein
VKHAAGGVAVQRGGGAAERLDASDRGDVEMIERGLTIGERGGNAIDEHAHAAHAELCATAEAAHRQPLTHREVEAVLDLYSGHCLKRLLEENRRACALQLRAGERRDRARRAQRHQ